MFNKETLDTKNHSIHLSKRSPSFHSFHFHIQKRTSPNNLYPHEDATTKEILYIHPIYTAPFPLSIFIPSIYTIPFSQFPKHGYAFRWLGWFR